MSLFEDAMQIAVQLPLVERERLARALGLSVHTKTPGKTLPLNAFVSNPATDPNQSAAWRRAERGHAVLDTGEVQAPQTGPRALFGLWSNGENPTGTSATGEQSSVLPTGSPVVVHFDVCWQLAQGSEKALHFFESPHVEVRLATASYLVLLEGARDVSETARVQGFIAPYAVLSLGPMASSRAVELMASSNRHERFGALDALSAATALAHEIPIVTYDPDRFSGINELRVLLP